MRSQTPTSMRLESQGCSSIPSSIRPNRRMRTRMSGGVAGEERRLSPLCRFKSADARLRRHLLIAPAGVLRSVHGSIRCLEQNVFAGAVFRVNSDSQAYRALKGQFLKIKWFVQAALQAFRNLLN